MAPSEGRTKDHRGLFRNLAKIYDANYYLKKIIRWLIGS